MTKRPHYFGEGSPLQRKIHVTEKRVKLGVETNTLMKAVYERTLALLFNGAKNMKDRPIMDDMSEHYESPPQPLPGQLRLIIHNEYTRSES